MMDTTFGNKAFPLAFRSSLAISAFEPAVDELPPPGIDNERVTYLKISASITGYQPTKAEIDAGYAQFPDVPIEAGTPPSTRTRAMISSAIPAPYCSGRT
ncbi:hypothetical protein GA0074695_4737 [Micromonospora viridifaciens]|uniref:Uncharacterized protein n=1 Tax=Micromonospora viridifaciens TaxID=1881 RepID=A0A1C4YVB0_MICVI|nr:hypothetical protein [Micromonospora viridifaciens]SCF24596.1 hypothetical protein GA0074695_4737 [Micromonospora viridifaciens]